MNQIEIIRSQFKLSSFYTLPSQNCGNVTQCRPISHEKTLRILNGMKKTTCNVYLCKIHFFMTFIGVLLRTWTQILRKSLFNGSFLQLWKKVVIRLLIKSCELHRELTIINPSVMYFSSPNALQRLSSFNSQHSLEIKTYCVPTRVPCTNTIGQKQWYAIYVMQSWKMLNVTT